MQPISLSLIYLFHANCFFKSNRRTYRNEAQVNPVNTSARFDVYITNELVVIYNVWSVVRRITHNLEVINSPERFYISQEWFYRCDKRSSSLFIIKFKQRILGTVGY